MSSITAGTSAGTALIHTADTTGSFVVKTGAGSTTGLTVDGSQIVTLAQPLPVGSGGTGATSLSGITTGTATNLAGGSNGTIPYQSASGTTQMLAVGTSGQVLQTNGAGAPTWVTVASGLSGATQAEMEAGSSSSVAVTPSVAQYHQSAAKCWIMCNAAGAIQTSYNITSITDTGVGFVTVTIATDFSSANYASVCSVRGADYQDRIPRISSQTAGSFVISNTSPTGVGYEDPGGYQAVCFGDQ